MPLPPNDERQNKTLLCQLTYNCILCGTCTCVPWEETLIRYQGFVDDRDFIHEDAVAWLKLVRLLIGVASTEQQYPNASSQQAYLTGAVRYRNQGDSERCLQFRRGISALDVDFGAGVKSIRGEGPSEVISVPETTLLDLNATRRHRIHAAIHENCVSILENVKSFEQQASTQLDIADRGPDIEPAFLDQLLTVYKKKKTKITCASNSFWEISEHDEESDEDILDKAPKSYFCDPMSQLHITRLRPFLGSTQDPDTSHEKFNSHLDQWQRALLLDQPSRGSDPFSGLPTEILMHITAFLSARETRMFCYASNATAWKVNQAGLWFHKLKIDMPWLWDITIERILEEQLSAVGFQSRDRVDWQAIYFDLREQSIYESRKRTLNLVNRRRIWNLCLSILRETSLDNEDG